MIMISLEEAITLIDNTCAKPMESERVRIEIALNRVLAEDVFTDMDFPSFNKSAMDGYAMQREDMSNTIRIIEFIPAGKRPEKSVVSGTCSKIMTGAMIPEGADMVVMKEDVTVSGEFITVVNPKSKDNILKQKKKKKTGNLLVQKGVNINPSHIGMLASVGAIEPLVYSLPIVSIISTGSELVSPEEKPLPPKIRDSNSSQLESMVHNSKAIALSIGHVADNIDMIFDAVQKALELSNIVVLTGGASVGDHDFTEKVFNKLDAKTHFTTLAIQPGKPVLFATVGKKYLFGLSGNPVSSFVQFHLLIKPLLNRLVGKMPKSKILKLAISIDKRRNRADRMLFFPVKISDNMEAEPLDYQGSAHLNAYQQADGMACFPIGFVELKKGTIIDVRPI